MPDQPGTISWVQITLPTLANYLQGSLVTVLNSKDLMPGQQDRFSQAMNDIVNEVRATIQSFKYGFTLSATQNSVPPELVRYTCYLIILAMQATCPELVLDDKQRKDFERAYKWADRYLDGTLKPSTPPDPAPPSSQLATSAEVVRSHHRLVTDESMRGVL